VAVASWLLVLFLVGQEKEEKEEKKVLGTRHQKRGNEAL